MRHLQRRKDVSVGIFLQRHGRDTLHQHPQRNEIYVAVDELRTWRVLWFFVARHSERSIFALPRQGEIKVWRESGVMREQLPHSDVFFAVPAELRQIPHNRITKPYLAKLQ